MFQWTDKGRENGSSMLNVMRNKDLAWVVSRIYDDDEDDQSLPECGGMNEVINVSDTPITTVMLPILQAPADDNDTPVSYTHLTLPTIYSV